MISLRDKLNKKDNDYTHYETAFKLKTDLALINISTKDVISSDDSLSISIVIPTRDAGEKLISTLSKLRSQTYNNFEVILVDDFSQKNVYDYLRPNLARLPSQELSVIRNNQNLGRSKSRNLGLLTSSGRVVIFIDDDMYMDENFLARLLIRTKNLEDAVFFGFRDTIDPLKLTDARGEPNIENDWRYSVKPTADFIPLYANLTELRPTLRDYRLLEESDNLRKLGCGKHIGFWDLPCFMISHSIAMSRKLAFSAGGYPENGFYGWGMEDIAFGAKLLAEGAYAIPALDWVSYHLVSQDEPTFRRPNFTELRKNLETYRELLGKEDYKGRMGNPRLIKLKHADNLSYYTYDSDL